MTESITSPVYSEASVATVETGVTDISQDDMGNAHRELFAIIAYDSDLCTLFSAAFKTNQSSADDFTITLRRSLRRLAQDLRSEVLFDAHKRAISFIAVRARTIARDIVNTYSGSSESKEQYPRDSSSSDGDGEDIQSSEQPASFDGMKAFIRSSAAFSKFITRIQRYVDEPPISWDSVRKQWEEEFHTLVPNDLPGNPTIRILESDNSPLVDRFKLALERYSAEEWIWKPFAQPRRKLEDGKLRVLWKCACGESYMDVSESLGQRLATLTRPMSGNVLPENGSIPVQIPVSAASQSYTQSSLPSQAPAPVLSSVLQHSSTPTANSRSLDKSVYPKRMGVPSQLESGPSTAALFVLICVPRNGQLNPGVISIEGSATDKDFFTAFKKEYRSLRGFWRYWLDPRQFAFCDATKFETFDIQSLGRICNEMPEEDSYLYVPKPAPLPYIPPLTVQEWRKRFYGCIKTQGRNDALQRIPKRNCRFELSTFVSREYMWGLHAHCQPSAAMVFLWTFLIILGGLCFAGWWLKYHHGDLQNAAVPVTLLIGAMTLLWLPLNKNIKNHE
ncbi:hypothetical protein GJ744_006953 [Endocarpon pusillum]|uniref:Uncharacterized protein n=1 Tax=Endocarpon pusillum TaxID=364733 RepID=A0A8H7ALJ1_9EURO|nr:hypothetical protein GJ744_006953 [Endocarpon pusillum]